MAKKKYNPYKQIRKIYEAKGITLNVVPDKPKEEGPMSARQRDARRLLYLVQMTKLVVEDTLNETKTGRLKPGVAGAITTYLTHLNQFKKQLSDLGFDSIFRDMANDELYDCIAFLDGIYDGNVDKLLSESETTSK